MLLVSSLMMVLAVHAAQLGPAAEVFVLGLTAPGRRFLCFKAVEYYLDYRENLIPGWKFDPDEWIHHGVDASQLGM